ncbi:MAG: SH3 domain-containing protein [Planctomycetes bacterium]|nr:SH3 domain-containing protein [Planctomycetota bacterium]
MRVFLLALTALAIAAPLQAASKRKTPYEATVEAEEVYVRSGAGSSKYYPTGKLRRGDKVTVQREDPGGWFMITPPPGSFSWVPGKHVRKVSGDQGVITSNGVAVRVGSFESDVRDVFQRTLSENDEVRILGEKMLFPESGNGSAELWYRIEPPRNEWRWIPGQAVAPLQRGDRTAGSDPFVSSESEAPKRRGSKSTPRAEGDAPSFEAPHMDAPVREYAGGDDGYGAPPETARENRPLVRKGGKPERKSAPPQKNQDDLFDELDRLDVRFRSILDKDALTWNFDDLERDYIGLRADADGTNLQRMIDTRLDRIANYRQVQAEEQQIAQIRDETSRRDAELAELQKQQEARLISARKPKYDGAGIVQRAAAARGTPRYVLVNQSGKILAYLVPAPGIDLERWIGQAAGVSGPRVPRPELQTDLITVNRIAPVRLLP